MDTVNELYELLNIDPYLLDNFKTSPGLLKHFYLTQLILSDNLDESNLGIKISLLLYRFDENTRLTDISQDPEALEILQKQNMRDMWNKLSSKRLGHNNDITTNERRVSPSALNSNNYLTGNIRSNSNVETKSPLGRDQPSRAKSKLTQQSEKSKSLLAVLHDEIKQSELAGNNGQANMSMNVVMENLQVLREALIDLGDEFDKTQSELEKLRLSEQKTN